MRIAYIPTKDCIAIVDGDVICEDLYNPCSCEILFPEGHRISVDDINKLAEIGVVLVAVE